MNQHKLSNIHPKAKIAENVTIDAFATIDEDVEIGEGTWIGPNACVMDGARVGKNCRIFPGAVISAIPQDLKFQGEYSTVEVGDNTSIREFCTIHKGTIDKKRTIIGKNCLLMAYVHVAHDCTLGDNVILANSVQIAGHVTIDDFAILEGLSAVQQFIHIGAHAFVAGYTPVRKNVPPYVKAARDPISYVGVNSVGLRRRGFDHDLVLQIEDIYRTLYLKGYNVSNAVEIIEKEAPSSKEKEYILQFIKASDKGIIRGPLMSDKKLDIAQ